MDTRSLATCTHFTHNKDELSGQKVTSGVRCHWYRLTAWMHGLVSPKLHSRPCGRARFKDEAFHVHRAAHLLQAGARRSGTWRPPQQRRSASREGADVIRMHDVASARDALAVAAAVRCARRRG